MLAARQSFDLTTAGFQSPHTTSFLGGAYALGMSATGSEVRPGSLIVGGVAGSVTLGTRVPISEGIGQRQDSLPR